MMVESYIGFLLSFLVGGAIVWLSLKMICAKRRVPRTEFDQLNAAYRDSVVENVKLEERIAVMQERVEELNGKLLKGAEQLSHDKDANDSSNQLRKFL